MMNKNQIDTLQFLVAEALIENSGKFGPLSPRWDAELRSAQKALDEMDES